MELRQLAYFVAVAEEGNVTRAAQRVRVAQPAVSQQIRGLERELGETLFDRGRRGMDLTEAGLAFLPYACEALAAARRGQDAVAALRGLLTGRLCLGTVHPAPPGLADLIGVFHRHHPGIEMSVREDHTARLLGAVVSGDLDAAFVGLPAGHRLPSGLEGTVIAVDSVVLAVHRDHELAGCRSLTLEHLKDQPMVTLPVGSGQRAMLEEAARGAGFAARVVAESSQIAFLLELAAAGVGVALVPESAVQGSAALAVVPVRPRLERRLILACRPVTASPATRAFLAVVRTHLAAGSA